MYIKLKLSYKLIRQKQLLVLKHKSWYQKNAAISDRRIRKTWKDHLNDENSEIKIIAKNNTRLKS